MIPSAGGIWDPFLPPEPCLWPDCKAAGVIRHDGNVLCQRHSCELWTFWQLEGRTDLSPIAKQRNAERQRVLEAIEWQNLC